MTRYIVAEATAMHRVLLAITIIVTLSLCGCGQTGPLVLPEENSDSSTSTAE